MSPLPVDDGYGNLLDLRGQLIATAADILESLALTPRLANAQVERMIAGVRPLVEAFEASVMAAHTSSARGYAMGDLPKEQKEAYDRAGHALRLLDALYGPKAVLTPPAGVGG